MNTMRIKDLLEKENAQITIEAILIIGFFILIFFSITVPMAFKVAHYSRDLSVASDARFAFNEILSAANSVVVNGSRRTISIYIPGYNASDINETRITVICNNSDGSKLVGFVFLAKNREIRNFSSSLYGSNWQVSDASGDNKIMEIAGRRHVITVEYKKITSNLTNPALPAFSSTINNAITSVCSAA